MGTIYFRVARAAATSAARDGGSAAAEFRADIAEDFGEILVTELAELGHDIVDGAVLA